MIEIKDHAEGCVVSVRAQPGARQAGIVGEHAGALKVAVHAAPEHGKANKALVETIAAALGLKRSQVALLSGETGRAKHFLVRGLSADQLRAALAAKLAS